MLVPADKATSNSSMQEVFLEVVLKEITATSTYEFVDKGCESVVAEHLCTYHVTAVHYDQLSSLFVL